MKAEKTAYTKNLKQQECVWAEGWKTKQMGDKDGEILT